MHSSPWQAILILIATATILCCISLRYDPQRRGAKLLQHGVQGLLMLLAWNLLPLPHLGVNPLSAMLTGMLGAPGLGLMAVLNLLP